MEIRKVPISLLNAAPYNPRKDLQPGDPEYQKIARSIEKYGCVEPIIWNEKTGNVIGGHQRLKVLVATGAVEVDVSVVQLSLEDEKALNLALNKISGQWDNEKLSAVLQDLSAGFDVAGVQPSVAPASDEVQTAQPGGKKTVIVPNLSEQDATTLVDVLKDMGFAYRLEDAA